MQTVYITFRQFKKKESRLLNEFDFFAPAKKQTVFLKLSHICQKHKDLFKLSNSCQNMRKQTVLNRFGNICPYRP